MYQVLPCLGSRLVSSTRTCSRGSSNSGSAGSGGVGEEAHGAVVVVAFIAVKGITGKVDKGVWWCPRGKAGGGGVWVPGGRQRPKANGCGRCKAGMRHGRHGAEDLSERWRWLVGPTRFK
jgi:hypothetical protein